MPHDALLLVSFGGPEGPADVLPFLRNVTAGRGIPAERLVEVAAHYDLFGGVSPINGLNRSLLAALRGELAPLPVYWGNRNWTPYLTDTLREMRDDGVRRALAFVTSAYSSYSGCRQYREDIASAQEQVGAGAPAVDKIRTFYDHPGFVEPFRSAVDAALDRLPAGVRDGARLVFTAHSVPVTMAHTSAYVQQLRETARLVAGNRPWTLAWQSRSGPPHVAWLEPDVSDELAALAAQGVSAAVVVPIGFVSDHLEVVHDLDTVAVPDATAAGMLVERAATPGDDRRLVTMVRELVEERTAAGPSLCLGVRGRSHDGCPRDCCPAPARPVRPAGPAGS